MVVFAVLAAVAAIALVPAARLFITQGRLIFRPGRRLDRSPADLGVAYESVRLPLEGGGDVEAWWLPGNSAPAVLYLHGSDGNLTHELPALRFLRSLGRPHILAVEYPGYAGDGTPGAEGCHAAARAGWSYLVDRAGIGPEAVVAYGTSLGGAVAVRLAADRRCGGLVIEGTFTSVADMAARAYPYLPVRLFLRTRMDSEAEIRRVTCPVLVVHSADDAHIPLEHAERLYQAAPPPKRMVTLRGKHGSAPRTTELVEAWRALLAGGAASWAGGESG